jgi:hypothetical protein
VNVGDGVSHVVSGQLAHECVPLSVCATERNKNKIH